MAVILSFFAIQTAGYGLYGDTWAYQGFVEDIKREVPPNDRVFMEDTSGRLALLSQRAFVSGDGLVNSNRYLDRYLLTGRIGDFLKESHIQYFLTSNIQCYPYRKVMPWTRTIGPVYKTYRLVVDLSYLTRLPVIPSIVEIPVENLVFDKCVNGIREMLFWLGK